MSFYNSHLSCVFKHTWYYFRKKYHYTLKQMDLSYVCVSDMLYCCWLQELVVQTGSSWRKSAGLAGLKRLCNKVSLCLSASVRTGSRLVVGGVGRSRAAPDGSGGVDPLRRGL